MAFENLGQYSEPIASAMGLSNPLSGVTLGYGARFAAGFESDDSLALIAKHAFGPFPPSADEDVPSRIIFQHLSQSTVLTELPTRDQSRILRVTDNNRLNSGCYISKYTHARFSTPNGSKPPFVLEYGWQGKTIQFPKLRFEIGSKLLGDKEEPTLHIQGIGRADRSETITAKEMQGLLPVIWGRFLLDFRFPLVSGSQFGLKK